MFASNSYGNPKPKLAAFPLILIIIFSLFGCSPEKKSGEDISLENNYDFAKILLKEDDINHRTDGYLLPQRQIELLDLNSEIVAEYIEFQNESKEYIGYTITDVHSNHIYDYSNEGNLFEGLLLKSGLTYEDAYEGKVYFVNLFEIYLELDDGRIIDLMPQSGIYPSEITRNQLEEAFSLRQLEYGTPIVPK